MPPLVCLGRRWRTGSDDFVLSGVVFGVCQIAMGITSAAMLGWHGLACKINVADLFASDPAASASGTLPPHVISLLEHANSARADEGIYSMASNALLTMRLQSGAYLLSGIFLLALAFSSSRGRIMEYHRRALTVPIFLYLSFLGLIAVTALSVVIAVFIYGSSDRLAPCRVDGAYHGMRTRAIAHGQCLLGFFPLVVFSILFFASFDPYGRKTFSEANGHTYADLWDSRFGWLICRCFRRDDASEEAFKDIAAVFSNIFQGVDLVPSDIAAGMVLVRGHQHRVLGRQIKGKAYPPSSTTDNLQPTHCDCCVKIEEKVSRQSRIFSPITDELRADIDVLHRYRRFFMATYGWALAIFKDPKEALPMICCNPCFYCRDPQWGHAKGEWCMCDSNILLRVGHLTEDDVIVTDFRNGLYQSPHFVVIDQSLDRPELKSVVVGIRGSMSINDALTDMVATPAEIVFRSEAMRTRFASTGPCCVHAGMLKTTENVLSNLESSGVLRDLTEGKYKDLKLVLVGHSLGAGAVVILSILLHDRYPSLTNRLTCVAYAPPGGLLTKNLSDYTATYVVAGFFGVDVVPRLAVHTIEDLRTSIIDAVCAADEPKASVFCKVMNPTKTKLLPHDRAPPADILRARDKLLKSGVSPDVLQRAALTTSSSPSSVSSSSSQAVTTPLMSGDESEAPRTDTTALVGHDGAPMIVVETNNRRSALSPGDASASTVAGVGNTNTNTNTNNINKSHSRRQSQSVGNFSASHAVGSTSHQVLTQGQQNAIFTPPVAALSATGGRPVNYYDHAAATSAACRQVKLFPPGRLVHFAKAITRDTKCLFGAWNWSRTEFYVPTHIGVEAVQEIICCPRMVTDHFPNNLFYVIEDCHDRLSAGSLNRFFEEADGEGGHARVAVLPEDIEQIRNDGNGGGDDNQQGSKSATNRRGSGRSLQHAQPLSIDRPLSPTTSGDGDGATGLVTPAVSMANFRGKGGPSIDTNRPFPSPSPQSPYVGGLSTIAYRFPLVSSSQQQQQTAGGGGGTAASFTNIAPSSPLTGSTTTANGYGGVVVTSRQPQREGLAASGSVDGGYVPYRGGGVEGKDEGRRK